MLRLSADRFWIPHVVRDDGLAGGRVKVRRRKSAFLECELGVYPLGNAYPRH